MPGQQSLSYNQGAVSAVIFMVKNGVSLASRLFKHQDFTSVQNHVDDRTFLQPLAAPSPKMGDTLTFETYPDADGLLYTDFRFQLPGLLRPPPGSIYDRAGILNTSYLTNPADQPDNSDAVNPGVHYNTAASAQTPTTYRYRIPHNPGILDLLNHSDYACIPASGASASGVALVPTLFITEVPTDGYYTQIQGVPNTPNSGDITNDTYSTGADQFPCPVWVDSIGYYAVERLTLTQGSNFIQSFTGEDLFKVAQKWNNQETAEHYRIMTGGWRGGSDLENVRWTLQDHIEARYRRRLCVPLDLLYWVGKITQFLPIVGLSRPIQIKIKLRDPQYCYLFEQWSVPQNGSGVIDATGLVIGNPDPPAGGIPLRVVGLELHKFHVNQVVRKDFLAEMNNPQGLRWKSFDIERQDDIRLTTQANTSTANIQILGLKGGVTSTLLTKIHNADKQEAYRTFWTNFLRIGKFSVLAGKDEIIPVTDHFYERYRLSNLYNVAKLSDYNIYMHSFNPVPNDKFNAWGHMEFGQLFNPTLKLEYPCDYINVITAFSKRPFNAYSTGSPIELPASPTAGPLTKTRPIGSHDHLVDLMALTHQFIQQKSGEVIRVFN